MIVLPLLSAYREVVAHLTADQWQVTNAYDNFDAGIDFDFIILEKEGEEILMGWDNWFEGELGCSPALLEQIEMLVHSTFKIAEPENLKPEVIALDRQWKEENQRKRN